MGTVVSLHARFSAACFRSKGLIFGQEWHTRWHPEDLLEFSEYARDRRFPHGSWLVFCAGLGVVMWTAILAVML